MKDFFNKLRPALKKYWMILAGVLVVIGGVVGYNIYVSADSSFSFTIGIPAQYSFEEVGEGGRAAVVFGQYNYNSIPEKFRPLVTDGGRTRVNMDDVEEKVGIIWHSMDENSVFYFDGGIDTGTPAYLYASGAGTSKIYASYNDFVYIDENGAVVPTKDAAVGIDRLTSTASNVMLIKVPLYLKTNVGNLGGATLSDGTNKLTKGTNLYVSYNAYRRAETVGTDTHYYNDAHEVKFKYNPNLFQVSTSINQNSGVHDSFSVFTAIGGGWGKISAYVGDDENPECSANIDTDIYIKPEFTITDLTIKQNEVHPLSSAETNVNTGNFGYQEDGRYSLYFWTYEEYQDYIGNTGNIKVVDVSESGVITGKYAGKTTLYMSCKPMEESYLSVGNLDTSIASSLSVSVPFEKYFEDHVIVSVGDTIPILTSAYIGNVEYVNYNNSDAIASLGGEMGARGGYYTAIKAGEAEVKVTAGYYENGVKVDVPAISVFITVIDKLMISKDYAQVNIGQSTTVSAIPTCKDQSICSNVSWSSSDPSIATVEFDSSDFDSCLNATVKGIKKGSAVITCMQTVNGVVKLATMNLTVTVPVDGITLSEPSNGRDHLTMYLGQTNTIFAYLIYENNDVPDNTSLVWTVSGDQLLTLAPLDTEGVTQSCQITATGIGQTTVTCYSIDSNEIVSCDVVITEQPTSITLSETNKVAYMSLGEYQLKAYVNSANGGADQTVIWSSLDESVCKVDPDTGLVTFVSPGNTYICATSAVDPSVTAYCYFQVAQDVYGIILDKSELTLKVGDTYRITASVNPDDAFDKTMVWTSSNPEVVAVEDTPSYENLLTAVGSGSTTIFAETNDGGYIAYCNIRVLQPVLNMTISSNEMTVRKGTEFYLNAVCLPDTSDDKTVVWSSNDDTIATVNSEGKVSTIAVGQCVITATNPDSGVSVSCTVNVLEPVTGISLNTYYQNMVKDSKFVLIPTVEPLTASDKSVTYWSSDPNVATVDEKGVITANNGGTCEIVVTTNESSLSAKCTIAVKEYVSSIVLSDEFRYLNLGDTYKLSASVGTDTATDKTINWTSSNPAVATVNEKGEVTGVGYGNVVITATAADGSGVTASCIFKVIKPVTSITLDHQKTTMYVGDVIHITATVNPADATVPKLEWTSSDPTIARVYDDGDVEAVSVGRCKIFATSTDGNNVVAECTIIVKQIVQATSLTINSDEILMLKGKTRTLSTRLYPTNSTESVKWFSTDTSVVTVDQNGQITTVGVGVADVVAYTTYGTVQDTCRVYSMAMSRSDLNIEQYDSYTLYADGAPSAASWRSSNYKVATVTSNGLVVARMPGETTITATVQGKTVSCYVRVLPVDPGRFINQTDDNPFNNFNKDLTPVPYVAPPNPLSPNDYVNKPQY